jgi:hypothetical protein
VRRAGRGARAEAPSSQSRTLRGTYREKAEAAVGQVVSSPQTWLVLAVQPLARAVTGELI